LYALTPGPIGKQIGPRAIHIKPRLKITPVHKLYGYITPGSMWNPVIQPRVNDSGGLSPGPTPHQTKCYINSNIKKPAHITSHQRMA
jgi:hypothetical protein